MMQHVRWQIMAVFVHPTWVFFLSQPTFVFMVLFKKLNPVIYCNLNPAILQVAT
jgi:hypothetical protein